MAANVDHARPFCGESKVFVCKVEPVDFLRRALKRTKKHSIIKKEEESRRQKNLVLQRQLLVECFA